MLPLSFSSRFTLSPYFEASLSGFGGRQIAAYNNHAAVQALAITNSRPGTTCTPKCRPPLVKASTTFVIVLVANAARTGNTALFTPIVPADTSDATDTAGECVSANPLRAAASITPHSPCQAFSAAAANNMIAIETAKISAVFKLNAWPLAVVSGASERSVFSVRSKP